MTMTKIIKKAVKPLINILIFLILLIISAALLSPIYLTIMRSLGSPDFTALNYIMLVFTQFELPALFPRYLINTILVTVAVTVLQLWISTPAAYALAKIKFPGSVFLNKLVEIGLLFGASSFFVTQYIVLNKMRLINTFPAIILPVISTSLGVFLLRQFIMQIPDNLIETARLDGVSNHVICRDVIIPQIKPARVTLVIFAINAAWRAEVHNFVYSEKLKTLASVMRQIDINEDTGVALALAVVMMSLPLLAFMFMQNSVIETMAHGKIKE